MKKLLIKLLVLCMFVAMPFLYLNARYIDTNYYQTADGKGKFKKIDGELEIVNLGNSHEMAGILYTDDRGFKGYNLALHSQPFEYDYNILDFYSDHIAENATVIIPISHFDWYYNYKELFHSNISTYNQRYYSILDKEHIMDYELKDDILFHYLPALTAGENLTYIFADIEVPEEYVENIRVVEDIDYTAKWKYESWTNDVMATDNKKKERVKKENIFWLKKIIELCYKNSYKPVLITSPITEQLGNKFSDEFMSDFYETIEGIKQEYPGLLYFDYSDVPGISDNLECFMDADHLNTRGARIYSERLFNDLETAGVLTVEN